MRAGRILPAHFLQRDFRSVARCHASKFRYTSIVWHSGQALEKFIAMRAPRLHGGSFGFDLKHRIGVTILADVSCRVIGIREYP
jgi:hypothetical protein